MKTIILGAAGSIHLARWANALVDRGIEVVVVSQHAPSQIYDPRITLRQLPFRGYQGYFLNVPALRRMLREEKPDLLHAHFASGYGTLGRLARFHPYLLSVWGSDVYLFPGKGALARALVTANLLAADRILSTSSDMAQVTRSICGRDSVLTPFGVDTIRFSPGSVGRANVVGTVRGLEPVYGIDILLRAFAIVVGNGRVVEPRLEIAGDGPSRRALENLAAELGIERLVRFHGGIPHERVPDFLRGLTVFAALSRSESFCVAALEAEACGIPVVASNVGGLPEVVGDGLTGMLVKTCDPSAAAEAIEQLLVDGDLRNRMSILARGFVRDRYEQASCVDRLLRVYQKTIDGETPHS